MSEEKKENKEEINTQKALGNGDIITQEQLNKLIKNGNYMIGTFTVKNVDNSNVRIIGYKPKEEGQKNNNNPIKEDFVQKTTMYFQQSNEKYEHIIDERSVNLSQGTHKVYYLIKNDIVDMSYMFYYCSELTELDISHFNPQNVTNMSYMFHSCSSLKKIIGGKNVIFDTKNVKDMNHMFCGCENLNDLNLENWSNTLLTDMSYMFYGCHSLITLTLTNFKTPKVETMDYMFYECYFLNSLDIRSFNTENVKKMSHMFCDCYSLENILLGNEFSTKNVKNMSYMFSGCNNLTTFFSPPDCLPNDSGIPDSSDVFNGCGVFFGCEKLKGLGPGFFRRFFCCDKSFKHSFTVKEFWDIIKRNTKPVGNNENLNLINTNENDNNINSLN